MLATRCPKRLLPFAALLLIILSICLRFWSEKLIVLSIPGHYFGYQEAPITPHDQQSNSLPGSLSATSTSTSTSSTATATSPSLSTSDHGHEIATGLLESSEANSTHRELHSLTTADKKYFPIKFGNHAAINPNIIPHPVKNDTWIIVAQLRQVEVINVGWNAELVCEAVFKAGGLECVDPPWILSIGATPGDNCKGELEVLARNIGPHDARVFYGPKSPFAMWGSNSEYVCFGLWMQDFRNLVNWAYEPGMVNDVLRRPTELQRPLPGPYNIVEKNWFVFWDQNDEMYAHYEVAPKRFFSKLNSNGSAGLDLAPLTALNDDKCVTTYMPTVGHQLETIHQATNSLSITMCQRSDPTCIPSDLNTFVFTIFHWRSFYNLHAVYEPYVMMFSRQAPFAMHAISQKPIWISGRGRADEEGTLRPRPQGDSEMVYITSMSWKAQGQKYHGYIDDVLFFAFGIEDRITAGMDFVAGDIFKDLGFCGA